MELMEPLHCFTQTLNIIFFSWQLMTFSPKLNAVLGQKVSVHEHKKIEITSDISSC